jgi:hypothetical protein
MEELWALLHFIEPTVFADEVVACTMIVVETVRLCVSSVVVDALSFIRTWLLTNRLSSWNALAVSKRWNKWSPCGMS